MMGNCAELASQLSQALGLDTAPVAISFDDAADDARPQRPVAAGCQFWEWGAERRYVTTADDHANCSIGIHTHNLAEAPSAQSNELGATLAAMQGLDYVRPEEVAALPVLADSHSCVSYAPLAECKATPALVLIFANARQGLIITEAVSRVDDAIPLALGRPACALISAVLNGGTSASSLGCCGARAYLDKFGDDKTLWALHGTRLQAYVEAIETMSSANETLTSFHRLRRADIAAGSKPTVEESLARLTN